MLSKTLSWQSLALFSLWIVPFSTVVKSVIMFRISDRLELSTQYTVSCKPLKVTISTSFVVLTCSKAYFLTWAKWLVSARREPFNSSCSSSSSFSFSWSDLKRIVMIKCPELRKMKKIIFFNNWCRCSINDNTQPKKPDWKRAAPIYYSLTYTDCLHVLYTGTTLVAWERCNVIGEYFERGPYLSKK